MLDLEYAHAVAPKAKLVYVQAYDNYYESLGVAVGVAASMADIVSNSWVGGEYPAYDFYWNVGKPLLFASGDWQSFPTQGYVSYPCSANTVTCVGGTSLYVDASLKRAAETAWAGSGGGCSLEEPMPFWQGPAGSAACWPYRAAPDISAIGDPDTGVAVYISNASWGTGYYLVGGTSLSTPVLAGIFADIMTARMSFGKAKFAFLNPSVYAGAASNFPYFNFDVVTGNNGYPAGPYFDFVTGLGVPRAKNMANRFFGLK
jgi:subtilase family serine protease